VETVGLAPDGLRLTFSCRAAPLRGLAFEVGSRERPSAVFAGGRVMLATLDTRRLAERNDGAHISRLASSVDRSEALSALLAT